MPPLSDINPRNIILMAIGILFLAAVIPSAITDIFAANTTTWDAGTATIWTLIPLTAVAIFVIRFTKAT